MNTDVRTQINPEEGTKNGYSQVKDLMNTIHGYCMDYTKASFNFVHENQDLIRDVVKIGCKTAMVACVTAAGVSIAKIMADSQK